MAKVSVVIPVYNVEKYLQDCIDSLLNQSLEDIELIFVNDASPDNSLAILKKNQEEHPDKIVVIDSPVNMRQGGARNLGIAKASSEYIGFVDSDDFVTPAMYQTLYERIVETDADAAFMSAVSISEEECYDFDKAHEAEHVYKKVFDANRFVYLEDKKAYAENLTVFLSPDYAPSVWCGIYKKSTITDNNVYFPEHLKFEDNYWCVLMRCYWSSIAIAEGVGYCYRHREDSTTNKRNSSEFNDRRTIEIMLLDEVRKRGLWDKHYAAWEYLFANRYGINTFMMFVTRYDVIPYDKIQELQEDVNKRFPNWKQNAFLKKDSGLKQKLRMFAFQQKTNTLASRACVKLISLYSKFC